MRPSRCWPVRQVAVPTPTMNTKRNSRPWPRASTSAAPGCRRRLVGVRQQRQRGGELAGPDVFGPSNQSASSSRLRRRAWNCASSCTGAQAASRPERSLSLRTSSPAAACASARSRGRCRRNPAGHWRRAAAAACRSPAIPPPATAAGGLAASSPRRQRGRADAAVGRLHCAQEGGVVVRIGQQAQPGQRVLDLAAVEEGGAAAQVVGDAQQLQRLFQRAALVVAAEQMQNCPRRGMLRCAMNWISAATLSASWAASRHSQTDAPRRRPGRSTASWVLVRVVGDQGVGARSTRLLQR